MTIRTKPVTKEYESGWERTFGAKREGDVLIVPDYKWPTVVLTREQMEELDLLPKGAE